MKFKIIKKRILEYASDFIDEIFYQSIGKFKINQAKKIGENLAIPKKYYSKKLNDKEISNLGIPYFNTNEGRTIFVKPYKYKFQGRERITKVITTLGRDNQIVKSIVQTPGIPSCYRLEGKKTYAYGVTHVFDNKGNKTNHIWNKLESFEGSQEIMRTFDSTTSDGLHLHIQKSNRGCSCVGETSRQLIVNIGPKNNFLSNRNYFTCEDRFKNAKSYIESVRVANNSPRSSNARKHTLMPSNQYKNILTIS